MPDSVGEDSAGLAQTEGARLSWKEWMASLRRRLIFLVWRCAQTVGMARGATPSTWLRHISSRPSERGAQFRSCGVAGLGHRPAVTLLAQMQAEKETAREQLRQMVRARLRTALGRWLPGQVCWVYGSLTRTGGYREWSDVDLALEVEPVGRSICLLSSLLAEELGRGVDVVLLAETRLEAKIRQEGERWIG